MIGGYELLAPAPRCCAGGVLHPPSRADCSCTPLRRSRTGWWPVWIERAFFPLCHVGLFIYWFGCHLQNNHHDCFEHGSPSVAPFPTYVRFPYNTYSSHGVPIPGMFIFVGASDVRFSEQTFGMSATQIYTPLDMASLLPPALFYVINSTTTGGVNLSTDMKVGPCVLPISHDKIYLH
ncbi:hypothetical protein EDB86DRAFT_2893349 [Lactarius hatsudake]|nr:hypothetical protein EDB86DRAFT_2893349 [Lactarius hatsudake]